MVGWNGTKKLKEITPDAEAHRDLFHKYAKTDGRLSRDDFIKLQDDAKAKWGLDYKVRVLG